MGKLVIRMSQIPALVSEKNGPKLLRLIAQVSEYDQASGILKVTDIPSSLLSRQDLQDDSEKTPKQWNIEMNYVLAKLGSHHAANFMTGMIVNVEVVYRRETGSLVASDLYELNEPELVLSNIAELQEFEEI